MPQPNRRASELNFLTREQLFNRLWNAFSENVEADAGHYLQNMFAFYEAPERLRQAFPESGVQAEHFAKKLLRDSDIGLSGWRSGC